MKNHLRYNGQYVFRHHRSTGYLFTDATQLWSSIIERYGEQDVVAYLDISKAFNKLPKDWNLSKTKIYLKKNLPAYK